MTIHISILIYLHINCFIAGWLIGEGMPYKSIKEYLKIALVLIVLLVAALPLFSFEGIYDRVIRPLSITLQLDFWWRYFFTTSLYNLKEEELAQMNASTILYRSKNTITDRIYRYCTELVNKRNNYIHPNKIEENGSGK